ncbi:MAG: hypothetical protein ACPGEC_05120 [Flavobacteriales bacterium]
MISEIQEYETVLRKIPELIEKSHFKKRYIIDTLKMTQPTFYRKLKNLSFTTKELMSLAKILKPKEYYLYQMKMDIAESLEDYREGRVYSQEDIEEDMQNLAKMRKRQN